MKKLQLGIRGGGVKSLTSIGVLEALCEYDIKVSEISGTSIGSVVASLFGVGKTPEEIFKLFKESLVELYTSATRIKGGKGSSVIEQSVNAICDNKTLGDTEIPIIISSNIGGFIYTCPFIFSQLHTPDVTLGSACRASSSFPFLYERYSSIVNGRKLKFYDGGMVANPAVPIKNEEEIFVLSTFQKKKENTRSMYANAWMRPEKYADVIIKPSIANLKTLGKPADVETAFMLGYSAAKKKIKQIKELL